MRLEFTHEITDSRRSGKITQRMVVSVDYDPSEDEYTDIEVHVYQSGTQKVEISKLLDKAEGDPLSAIVEAITWREIYQNQYNFYDQSI